MPKTEIRTHRHPSGLVEIYQCTGRHATRTIVFLNANAVHERVEHNFAVTSDEQFIADYIW